MLRKIDVENFDFPKVFIGYYSAKYIFEKMMIFALIYANFKEFEFFERTNFYLVNGFGETL